jgi:acetyl esterase/lipase
VDYAHRLREAAVSCDLHVVEGAYHGFDVVEPKASVSRVFQRACFDAIDRALNGEGDRLPSP